MLMSYKAKKNKIVFLLSSEYKSGFVRRRRESQKQYWITTTTKVELTPQMKCSGHTRLKLLLEDDRWQLFSIYWILWH